MSYTTPIRTIQRRQRNTGSSSPTRASMRIRARMTPQDATLTNIPTAPTPSIYDGARDPSVSTGIRCNHRYQPLPMNLRNKIIEAVVDDRICYCDRSPMPKDCHLCNVKTGIH